MKTVLAEIFTEQQKRTQKLSELGDLPLMDDENSMLMEALYTAIAGAFLDEHESDHNLFYFVAGTMCKLTILHGISAFSANAFACFCGALAQYGYPSIYDFGAVSMKMHARIKVAAKKCKISLHSKN